MNRPSVLSDPTGLEGMKKPVKKPEWPPKWFPFNVARLEAFLKKCKGKCSLGKKPQIDPLHGGGWVECDGKGGFTARYLGDPTDKKEKESKELDVLDPNKPFELQGPPKDIQIKSFWEWQLGLGLGECVLKHEERHIAILKLVCPDVCEGCAPKDNKGKAVHIKDKECRAHHECFASLAELNCVKDKLKEFQKKNNQQGIQAAKWMMKSVLQDLQKYNCKKLGFKGF